MKNNYFSKNRFFFYFMRKVYSDGNVIAHVSFCIGCEEMFTVTNFNNGCMYDFTIWAFYEFFFLIFWYLGEDCSDLQHIWTSNVHRWWPCCQQLRCPGWHLFFSSSFTGFKGFCAFSIDTCFPFFSLYD